MMDLTEQLYNLNEILKKNIDSHAGYFETEGIALCINIRQLKLLQDSVAGWIIEIKEEKGK